MERHGMGGGLGKGNRMSTPFTAPAGATWQSLLTEITTAYSERRQAIGQSAYVPEERIVQPAAYWAGLQNWLETYCTSFVDSSNRAPFALFDLATWRAEAGLPTDGFRRVTASNVSTHGQMEAGDAIGPWIFEDLQKGFGALKYIDFFASYSTINNIFPLFDKTISFQGIGSGENFGVWYSYDQNRLGGSGTYEIALDDRPLLGEGSKNYVSLGARGIYLDSAVGEGYARFEANISVTSNFFVYGAMIGRDYTADGGSNANTTADYDFDYASFSSDLWLPGEGVVEGYFGLACNPFTNA